jgi:hypothetical protein
MKSRVVIGLRRSSERAIEKDGEVPARLPEAPFENGLLPRNESDILNELSIEFDERAGLQCGDIAEMQAGSVDFGDELYRCSLDVTPELLGPVEVDNALFLRFVGTELLSQSLYRRYWKCNC